MGIVDAGIAWIVFVALVLAGLAGLKWREKKLRQSL